MTYVPTPESIQAIHDHVVAEIRAMDFPTAILSRLYIQRIIGHGDQMRLSAKIIEWESLHATQNAPRARVRSRTPT